MMVTLTVGILTGSITAGRTISSSGTYRVFPILGTAISPLPPLSRDCPSAWTPGCGLPA